MVRLRSREAFLPACDNKAARSRRPRLGFRKIQVVIWFAWVSVALIAVSSSSAFSSTATALWAADDYSVLIDHSVSGIDPVDSDPYGIVLHPTQPLFYVAHAGVPAFADPELSNGSTVSEIDMESGEVVRTFDVGLLPTDLAVTSDGSELFVTTSTAGAIVKIDLVTGDVLEQPLIDSFGVPVSYPSGVLLSPDETQVWVASNGSSFDGSSENLILLDRATLAFLGSVEISGGLSRMAVRDDGLAVVPIGFPDDVFPSQPRVAVFDTTVPGWEELASFTLDVDTFDFPAPTDVVIDAGGSIAYVAILGGSNEVYRIALDTLLLLPALVLPGPIFVQHGLAMTTEGHLVVTDFQESQARVVDVSTDTVIATIPTGAQPNEIAIGGGRIWITGQLDEVVTVAALPGNFSRGDANLDSAIDVADGVAILGALFSGVPLSCDDAADVNDDGVLDLADPISLFDYLFGGGPAPSYPFALPGRDHTPDSLGCAL